MLQNIDSASYRRIAFLLKDLCYVFGSILMNKGNERKRNKAELSKIITLKKVTCESWQCLLKVVH